MVLTLSENRHRFLFNLVLVSVSLYRVSEKCTKIEHSNPIEKKQKFRRLYIYIYEGTWASQFGNPYPCEKKA